MKKWDEVVFSGRTTKPISERVMDRIIHLLHISRSFTIHEPVNIQDVRSLVSSMRTQLEELWILSNDESRLHGDNAPFIPPSRAPVDPNPVAHLTSVYFNCAWLLLSHLSFSYLDDYLEDITPLAYCRSILSSIEYLEGKSIGCAYMRMMLPLAFVSLQSPDEEQRHIAQAKIRSWHERRLMRGLCTISIHHLEKHWEQTRDDLNCSDGVETSEWNWEWSAPTLDHFTVNAPSSKLQLVHEPDPSPISPLWHVYQPEQQTHGQHQSTRISAKK